jgi:hypothetical protein
VTEEALSKIRTAQLGFIDAGLFSTDNRQGEKDVV